ncbi:MAG: hypothetical protein ABI792_07275 [bacterium]
MKKINLILVLSILFITGNIFAQGMMPPTPIKSAFLEASLGTWVSEPYQMMGNTMSDEITHKMILNGQFMEIDVRGKSDNGFVYEGMGIISPSSENSITGTFYDIFGKGGIMTYTGTEKGSNIYLLGTSNWGTESRDITIDGNTMIHTVTMNMKDANGKEMAPQTAVIKYHKK